MTDSTKKSTQTAYGSVEYETVECAECTNEYVLDELTLAYVTHSLDDTHTVTSSSARLNPLCTGCVEEVYGIEESLLTYSEIKEFVSSSPAQKLGVRTKADTEKREVMTDHGTVPVTVGQCDHCQSSVTVDDLCAVHFFVAIVNGVLQTTAPLNCPECRELYLNAPHLPIQDGNSSGPTIAEKRIAERDAREDESSTPGMKSVKRAFSVAIIGTVLAGIVIQISPALGGLLILLSWGVSVPVSIYGVFEYYAAEEIEPRQL